MNKGLLFTLVTTSIIAITFYFTSSVKAVNESIKNPLTLINTKLQSGDIIFQSSTSGQSLAIQLATNSKYSHVGIIYEVDHEYFVYEAVQPVKITPLNSWIARGDDNHYVVKRLINANNILTAEVINKMKKVGNWYLGKDYDLYFEWSDDRIYCSELVWKIYKECVGVEVGELQKLSEFDLTSDVVKKKLKERYGNNIPLNELVILPAAIFDSELLVEVDSN